jgi:hypothetical protein
MDFSPCKLLNIGAYAALCRSLRCEPNSVNRFGGGSDGEVTNMSRPAEV